MLTNGFNNDINWTLDGYATDDVKFDEAFDLAWQRDEALAWSRTHDQCSDYLMNGGDYTGSAFEMGQSIRCDDLASGFQAGIDDLGMGDFGL